MHYSHGYTCDGMTYTDAYRRPLYQTTVKDDHDNIQHYILQMTIDSSDGKFFDMDLNKYDKGTTEPSIDDLTNN